MNGNCPPGEGEEWGQSPIQAPRPSQPPSQPIQTPPASPSGPDYAKLADLIVGKMAGDERFRGPSGKDGVPGKDGMNGQDGQPGQPGKDAVVDYDKLAEEVMRRMPALVIQFTDKNGQVVEELPFQFDASSNAMVAKVKPLIVETYDKDGRLTDSDSYPYVWGIKLKPIVIPSIERDMKHAGRWRE